MSDALFKFVQALLMFYKQLKFLAVLILELWLKNWNRYHENLVYGTTYQLLDKGYYLEKCLQKRKGIHINVKPIDSSLYTEFKKIIYGVVNF